MGARSASGVPGAHGGKCAWLRVLPALDRALLRRSVGMMETAARDALEMTVRLFPENPSARHLLALTLFREGQLERALALYEGLAAEFPDSLAVRVNLAVVLLKLGRASSARPLLEEVVRLA